MDEKSNVSLNIAVAFIIVCFTHTCTHKLVFSKF